MLESSEKAAYFDAWDAETMQACVCDSRCARDAPPLHLCHGPMRRRRPASAARGAGVTLRRYTSVTGDETTQACVCDSRCARDAPSLQLRHVRCRSETMRVRVCDSRLAKRSTLPPPLLFPPPRGFVPLSNGLFFSAISSLLLSFQRSLIRCDLFSFLSNGLSVSVISSVFFSVSWPVGTKAGQRQSAEWFGVSCSLRRCPTGDDPRTCVVVVFRFVDERSRRWAVTPACHRLRAREEL